MPSGRWRCTSCPAAEPSRIPDEWWSAITAACRQAVAQSGVDAGRLIGMGATAQWSGTVAVAADGRPLMRAVIWMDSRGSAAIRRVAGGPVNVLGYDPRKILRWVQVTGGAPGNVGEGPVGPHPLHPRRVP